MKMKLLIIKYRYDDGEVQYFRCDRSFSFEIKNVDDEILLNLCCSLNAAGVKYIVELRPELTLDSELMEHYQILMEHNQEFAESVARAFTEEIEDAIEIYMDSNDITLNLNRVFENVSMLIKSIIFGYLDELEEEILASKSKNRDDRDNYNE